MANAMTLAVEAAREKRFVDDGGEEFDLRDFANANKHDDECLAWIDALGALSIGESVTFGWNGPIRRTK